MMMRKWQLWLATGATVAVFGAGGATLALLTDQAGPESRELVAGTLRLDGRRSG
ncbi:shikimate 5-dehydrogenase, partial [Symbiobacterium terraclitae]|nr:shikimate 5-dehydrogenase [Symbiobacterium terraclitae]